AKEFPTDDAAIEGFRQRYRRRFEVLVKEPGSIYQMVSKKTMPAGIENYLPLFFDETATLFDYLPDNTQLVTVGDIESATQSHLNEVEARYQDRRVDPLRPLLAPQELYLLTEQIFSSFKALPRFGLKNETYTGTALQGKVSKLPDVTANHKLKQPLTELEKYVAQGDRLLFSAESEGRREALLELLAKIDIKPKLFSHFDEFVASKTKLGLIVSPLAQGCIVEKKTGGKFSLICETELFGQRISQRRRRDK
ncbi:transcription-repair coupling factor, partial [Shewanella sp. 0m-11]